MGNGLRSPEIPEKIGAAPRNIGIRMAGRILGLDVGEKYMGVALSDPQGIVASPLMVIARSGNPADLQIILRLIRQYEVGSVVVGLPLSLNGSIGREAQRVQEFVQQLSQYIELPVYAWDERLSTVAAKKAVRERGVKKAKRKVPLDDLAAAFVLQCYLDRARWGDMPG